MFPHFLQVLVFIFIKKFDTVNKFCIGSEIFFSVIKLYESKRSVYISITSVKNSPDGQEVKVAFAGAGIRSLLTKYAMLKKL